MGLTHKNYPPGPLRPVLPYPYEHQHQLRFTHVLSRKNLYRATYPPPFQSEYTSNYRHPQENSVNLKPDGPYPLTSMPSLSVYSSQDQQTYGVTGHTLPMYDNALNYAHVLVPPPNMGSDGTPFGIINQQHEIFSPAQPFQALQQPQHFAPNAFSNGEPIMASTETATFPQQPYSYYATSSPYVLLQSPVGQDFQYMVNSHGSDISQELYNGDPCSVYVLTETDSFNQHMQSAPPPPVLCVQGTDTFNQQMQSPPTPSMLSPAPVAPLVGQQVQVAAPQITPPALNGMSFQNQRQQSRAGTGHFPDSGQIREPSVPDDPAQVIKSAASDFVDQVCPYLGEQPYCLPPVKRSRHPDKSSKQLVLGMESEKRVLGSFERFFAERQLPVFMLCHYPVSGFMQNYPEAGLRFSSKLRDPKFVSGKNDKDTLTLLLLSDKFMVTVVMVSITNGNSDFAFIQRNVQRAAQRMHRCGILVSQWLSSLDVNPKIRQVIAFPNLKKAMMQRITKDRQFQNTYGMLCTLHVDDLSAPFEEEWSTPVHKHLFSEWMHSKVLCHPPTLSRSDLHLVVGSLLSPRLSNVDFVKDLEYIEPIPPQSPRYTEKQQSNSEDVNKLLLTIDGVTKSFDEFMDEYVRCYYPDVESKSYRVPPIHFNIQSLRKAADFLKDHSHRDSPSRKQQGQRRVGDSDSTFSDGETKAQSHSSDNLPDFSFMPSRPPYQMSAYIYSNGTDSMGPKEEDIVAYEDEENTEQDEGTSVTEVDAPVQLHCHVQMSSVSDSLKNGVSQHRGRTKEKSQHSSPAQNSGSVMFFSQNSKSKPIITSAKSSPTFIISSSSPPQQASPPGKMTSASPVATSALAVNVKGKQAKKQLAATFEGVQVMSEVMTKDTRADEGENRVISALELLSQHYGPMFIVCGYQYNNYLNKLREEMFSKGEAKRPIRAFGQTMRAEHDCLIFHKQYGAIVVCIKAIGDNFSDWGASEQQKIESTNKILEKAIKQLEREEAMIRHVTSDLHPNMACHKLIAVPNLTRDSVQKALRHDTELLKKINTLTKGLGAKLFLCQDELPVKFYSVWSPQTPEDREGLLTWWELVLDTLMSESEPLDTWVYRQVIGRYCGLLSTVEVWSPTNPRMEVRSMSEAVNLCANRFHRLVLTPRQVELLCLNDRRVFLYGPPGCGKTLLLILKAKEWLLAGEKVILVNSRPGSKYGFPYAYGVFNRLKTMMLSIGVQPSNLFMINIDSLQFRTRDLACVLPSCCIIMDEVSPSSHDIIEHLCCLQVKNVWCAGLFEDDKPVTALHFNTYKLDKILRCPPIVQTLLKHVEDDVRLKRPYQNYYQTSLLQTKFQRQDSNKENVPGASEKEDATEGPSDRSVRLVNKKDTGAALKKDTDSCPEEEKKKNTLKNQEKDSTENESSSEDLKYDAESLNKRLMQKYGCGNKGKKEMNKEDDQKKKWFGEYTTSSVQLGLATDGPRPHIIDHREHSHPGYPMDCPECAEKLADYLESMVKSGGSSAALTRDNPPSKNKFAFKSIGRDGGGRGRVRKSQDAVIYSNQSAIHTKLQGPSSGQKLGAFFDSKALTWSDVLIAAREVQKNCTFVSVLQKRGIPVEVLMSGPTHHIETSKDRKLFVTSYKEVTGVERALIVFVPLGESLRIDESKSASGLPDLHLGQGLERLTEEDRSALWHVASRSLALLVLILP